MNAEENREKLKVLVVEDDAVSRLLLGEILRDLEMSTYSAYNGKQAIAMVKEDKSYAFILLDLKMPIMDGFEVIKRIRELGYNKPIIAQTAYSSDVDIERINNSGFDAYITKPIIKIRLLEIISEITHQPNKTKTHDN